MRKKNSPKSNYRPPTRSEKILAIVGLLVVGSLIFSAIAPNFGTSVLVPTDLPTAIIFLPTDTPTATATSVIADGTPLPPTPGQAPAPNVTP